MYSAYKLNKQGDNIQLWCIGLPWWLRQQKICLQCGRPRFNPWVRKILWSKWQPTPVLLPGKSHGWRSLAVYKSMGLQRVGHNWATSISQLWTSLLFHVRICYFLICIQISQEAGKVIWYSYLFKNFQQFVVIHTIKGFGIVNEAEVDVFLELSCFFYDPTDVGNLISGSSAFSNSSLYTWKFSVHVL